MKLELPKDWYEKRIEDASTDQRLKEEYDSVLRDSDMREPRLRDNDRSGQRN